MHGDLVNALDFRVQSGAARGTMGQDFKVAKSSPVTITIRFRSPAKNNNGDAPVVDHIDLIAGQVRGKVAPTLADGTANPDYSKDTNETTSVVATFNATNWTTTPDGWTTMTYTNHRGRQQVTIACAGPTFRREPSP